jgi:hypothetical protein
MKQLLLNLSLFNGYFHPQAMDEVSQALLDMNARIEGTQDFEEKDLFFTSAFETGFEALDTELALNEIQTWCINFSQSFPDLVFSLDAQELEGSDTIWRWYIADGKVQKVTPYQVIPDFDPQGGL